MPSSSRQGVAAYGRPSDLRAEESGLSELGSVNGEAVMTLLRELHRNRATICMVTQGSPRAIWVRAWCFRG